MGKSHLFIAGHGIMSNGRFDSGAIGYIKKGEHKYMVENLFPAIKRHLPKGHNIVFFTSHNVVSHGDLVSLVKKYNADQVTEFHYDAASASARGGHVIIHSDYSPDKTDLALRDAIDSMVGVRYSHKGHKGISGRSNLGNANRARNAGITYRLLELGFGTNKTDAKILVDSVDEYAKAIIKAVTGQVVVEAPKSEVKSASTDKEQSKPAPKKKSVDQLANEVIAGKHGSGDARKKALGNQFDAVQKRVNEILGAKSKPKSKSIDTLVKETLAGKHGNGDTRKKSLGKNYKAVMDVINGKKTTSKPKTKPKSTSSIKSVGKIKVDKVNNFTYIYASTSDKSKQLGKANKNSIYDISGSVSGWYEIIHNGKRAYVKSKYCSRV